MRAAAREVPGTSEVPGTWKPLLLIPPRMTGGKIGRPSMTGQLEGGLNALVYELYVLTKDEIAIIEGRG